VRGVKNRVAPAPPSWSIAAMQAVQSAPFIRQTIPTPIGGLTLIARGDRLCMAEFADCEHRMAKWLERRMAKSKGAPMDGTLPPSIAQCFSAYFDGEVAALDRLEVEFSGTAFQNEVWAALRGIPPGRTFAYGAFAEHLGRPQAARAVGHANGANPLSVVVPCHRLVGADGALTNYGGGLWRKRWLLDHEFASGAFPTP
jgi:methylated-DNA-[protein]-cysteine S-methyltransferase